MVRVDPFAVFLGVVVIAATALAVLLSIAYLRREGLEAPEYLGLVLLSGAGMLAMTTANDLIVVFLALEVLSIPLYVLDRVRPAAALVAGGRHQVLRARRVLLGDLPVRRRPHVRRDGHHVAHRDRAVPRAERAVRPGHARSPASRCCSSGSGFKVAAVPFHMWTPDVYQGAPDAGHRVHGRGDQGRRVRRAAPRLRRRVPAVLQRLAPGRRGARRAVARRRERRGGRADRREADPRVLVDRARRLHPDGVLRRTRRGVAKPRSSTCSSTRSCRSARSRC